MSPSIDSLQVLFNPIRHLFLSPHYDDIPLSAGATVRLLADAGRSPETVIVFGSEPDPAQVLSTFAQTMHNGWGFTAADVVARRQAEESAAAGLLGASVRLLPFRDAIYRGDSYRSDDDLFSDPHPAEGTLPELIAASLALPAQPLAGTRFYAPLAVGRHVDHQIVFQAGSRLSDGGWDVWFYEDIPYALKSGALQRRLEEIRQSRMLSPVASIAADGAWSTKIEAILCYPSQLDTIFRHYVGIGTSGGEISAAIAAFSMREDEKFVGERFWKLDHASSRAGS